MQAARRVLQSAGILSRRSMTTAAQLAADAGKPKGSIVDTIGVYTVTPLAIGVFIYDMFIAHEVRARHLMLLRSATLSSAATGSTVSITLLLFAPTLRSDNALISHRNASRTL